jgi:hypothetical protein
LNPPSIYTILSDRVNFWVFWIISKESERSSPFPKDYLLQKNEYQTGGGVGLNGIAWAAGIRQIK